MKKEKWQLNTTEEGHNYENNGQELVIGIALNKEK